MADVTHRNQTGLNAAHPPFYASESDPTTTLGAYRGWIKPSTGEVKIRNTTNTDWIALSGGGGGSGAGAIWEAVRLASTVDVDILAPGFFVDGAVLSEADPNNRVLLKNQTSPDENGIYDWVGDAVPMTRSADADAASEFQLGKLVTVLDGDTNISTLWQLQSTVETLDTDTITFAETSPPPQGRNLVIGGEEVTTSTTYADIFGYSFPVEADRIYLFDAMLFYTSAATTTGAKFAVNGPAFNELGYMVRQPLTSTTESVQYLSTYNAAAATATSLTVGNLCQIKGRVWTSASGDIQLRFATEVGGSAITVRSDSILEWLGPFS